MLRRHRPAGARARGLSARALAGLHWAHGAAAAQVPIASWCGRGLGPAEVNPTEGPVQYALCCFAQPPLVASLSLVPLHPPPLGRRCPAAVHGATGAGQGLHLL
eukprot:14531569-Alexandrium_andersonii.AAC.1